MPSSIAASTIENWDDLLIQFQSLCNLDTDEVARVINTPAAGIVSGIQPPVSDEHENDFTGGHALFDSTNKMDAGSISSRSMKIDLEPKMEASRSWIRPA
jgi:hypothetical protein